MKTLSLKLEVPWEEVKERLKENDITLTDEDLVYIPGHEKELLDHLSEKINRTPEQVKDLIESISANEGRAS
ncbi:MAG: general stress protein CsbD [Bacteroidota bacterium]